MFGAPAVASTSAAPTPLSFGAAKPAAAAPLGGLVAKPTVPGAPVASAPVPSLLKGKTLEDIVNNWSNELEERTRDFSEIAGEVREWDRVLRENGEQVRDSSTLGMRRRWPYHHNFTDFGTIQLNSTPLSSAQPDLVVVGLR